MASAELSRRVAKVVGYPPLSEMSDLRRREFHEALLDADTFEDLPGNWQAAILEAERSRPKLRDVVKQGYTEPGRYAICRWDNRREFDLGPGPVEAADPPALTLG